MSSDIRQQATDLFRAGEYDQSAVLYQRLIDDDIDKVAGHAGLGVIALKQGRVSDATAEFHAALELDPTHANSLYYLAYIVERGGNAADAAVLYRAVLALHPGHASAVKALERTRTAAVSLRRTARPAPPQPAAKPAARPEDFVPLHGGLVRGLVTQLKVGTQQAWNTGRYKQVIDFRIVTQPDGGKSSQVEIRGQKIFGQIHDGDNVEILEAANRGGLLRASKIFNHTTQNEVWRRIW